MPLIIEYADDFEQNLKEIIGERKIEDLTDEDIKAIVKELGKPTIVKCYVTDRWKGVAQFYVERMSGE